jgi:hypothetical protein
LNDRFLSIPGPGQWAIARIDGLNRERKTGMDPDADADFYSLEQLLDDDGLRRVMAVREFME